MSLVWVCRVRVSVLIGVGVLAYLSLLLFVVAMLGGVVSVYLLSTLVHGKLFLGVLPGLLPLLSLVQGVHVAMVLALLLVTLSPGVSLLGEWSLSWHWISLFVSPGPWGGSPQPPPLVQDGMHGLGGGTPLGPPCCALLPE